MFANESTFDNQVAASSSRYGVPAAIVKAVIGVESGFDSAAFRDEPGAGDSIGLMQLTPATAAGLGYQGTPMGLYDPTVNVDLGTHLLANLWDQLGDWGAVFSAYNGGVRPNLAFGARATRLITDICLAKNPAGQCIRTVDVQPGQFANQDYVDQVASLAGYFGAQQLAAAPVSSSSDQYSSSGRDYSVLLWLALPLALAAWAGTQADKPRRRR